MRKILFAFTLLLLSACTMRADFNPEGDNLNEATVGTPYYSQINIFGGRVLSYNIDGKQVIAGDIHPDNLGLHLHENLLARDFSSYRPNEKWLTDITEFQLPAGKVYLSPVIDCFDGQSPVKYRQHLGITT